MLTPRFLEGMNGTLSFLLAFGCIMFLAYISREIKENGFERTRLQGGISIFVLIFGEMISRSWIWWWRHLENSGDSADWMVRSPVLYIGAGIEILGIICVIRVFAPDKWGRNVWFVTTLLAVSLAVIFLFA